MAKAPRPVCKDWTIRREWEGQTCAVFASGKSMTPEVAELVRVHPGVRVVVVNNTHELAPWADVLYAADSVWWTAAQSRLGGKNNYANTEHFRGLKVCAEETPFDDVLQLKSSDRGGVFDGDATTVSKGSGNGAVDIAVHRGCNRILLCGFDMRGEHWHEPHPPPLRNAGDGVFKKWIDRFGELAPELAKRGITVLNCTPGSALRCFTMVDLEGALHGQIAA